jgi:hypothetical protein
MTVRHDELGGRRERSLVFAGRRHRNQIAAETVVAALREMPGRGLWVKGSTPLACPA